MKKRDLIFIHNVFNRFDTLIKTINSEIIFFPSSIFIIVMHQDHDEKPLLNLLKKNGLKAKILKSELSGHKKGCLNAFIKGLKYVHENQINGNIIFSHDDVYLKSIKSVNTNLQTLNSSKECFYILKNTIIKEFEYFSIECIYLKTEIINKIINDLILFKTENDIPIDPIYNSPSPELWVKNLIYKYGITGKIFNLHHEDIIPLYRYNKHLVSTLGYYHKNIGSRNWERNFLINKEQLKSWFKWIMS